jgi:hypothetical protein
MALRKIDVEQLFNEARVQLVGVSEGGLRGSFYDVMAEFFNDSSCWTQGVPIAVVPGTWCYSAAVPEGQIIRMVGVSDLNCNFVPALMPEVGVVQLKYPPNTAQTYNAQFVTNVALPNGRDELPIAPHWVLPIWHVGILDGILGKMMGQVNKSYSNPASSAYHLKRFRDAIARARISKLRANTDGAQAWRFPQSFRTAGQQGGVPAIVSGTERTF